MDVSVSNNISKAFEGKKASEPKKEEKKFVFLSGDTKTKLFNLGAVMTIALIVIGSSSAIGFLQILPIIGGPFLLDLGWNAITGVKPVKKKDEKDDNEMRIGKAILPLIFAIGTLLLM